MRFTDFLNDKDQFIARIKSSLSNSAFVKLEMMKKEIASDFIKGGDDK